jgi:hypothetical protein
MKKKNKAPLQVVSVSDLHCGSDVGLRPPVVKLANGTNNVFGDAPHHRYMWENWLLGIKWIKKVTGGKPFILLLNGDMIEGIHHGSDEVIAMQWEVHMEIALECLRPLCALADSIIMVRGTECHVRNIESALASKLGAEGGEAKDQQLFRVNGVLNEAQHHTGTTKRKWLESAEASRVMANNVINCVDAGQEPPRVFWRAHRHVGGYTEQCGRHFLICGAWQYLTRYGRKVVGDSIPIPTIQYMDFTDAEFPIHKEKKFFPPQAAIKEY